MTTTEAPSTLYGSDVDLFDDEVLRSPYAHFKALRDLGPAAYLTKYDMWILTRYDQVRAALHDWETFSSAQGVALNPIANEAWKLSALSLDPPDHAAQRKVFDSALRPKFIRKAAPNIERRAADLVDTVLAKGEFDGVTDFARVLPSDIVFDLVGFPHEGRDKILDWAEGSWNFGGPQNDRMMSAIPKTQALIAYLQEVATPENLLPDSFGRIIYDAVDRGEVERDSAVIHMLGYANAALDTTINAVSSMLMLFAQHPDQWAKVREDKSLVLSAFLEATRLESPAQYFSRVTTRDVELADDLVIPQGSRVVQSYAAANRDERHYPDPDTFDVTRNPVDSLTFDHGVHTCPGRSLSTMEGVTLFTALAEKVTTIDLTGEPVRNLNNLTRGLASLPLRVS